MVLMRPCRIPDKILTKRLQNRRDLCGPARIKSFMDSEWGTNAVEPRPVEGKNVWDKILGVSTMVVVSLGGWTAIIALVRLLR